MSNDAKQPESTEMTDATEKQSLEDRGKNRSRTPHSAEFLKYMGSGWADSHSRLVDTDDVAAFAAARRAKVAQRFAGKVVVIEAGAAKTRSNDTEYRYRAHAAFSHLTGWGSATVPDSVLVIDARAASAGEYTGNAPATLFFRPTAGRHTDEFFANPAIGEFWVGERPNLSQVSALLGIATRDLADLDGVLAEVAEKGKLTLADADLAEFVSELRLVKDEYEILEMRKAVAASALGFENIVRNLERATQHPRGERIVETAFFAEARANGNDLGYETIAASGEHACTLHWIINDGQVKNGDLILVDAGVEVDSLYTADITRTLPVNGKFSPIQRKIYEAVREAADAVFAIARPGIQFKELHAAAMQVIAAKTVEWGLLPDGVSAADSLDPEKQYHRRFMVHGTSHHLGIDVHDCAQARREMYLEGILEPGMVFTIEPGLYFHRDDLLVPEEYRGIGVRIEDDVLVTADGVENLSAGLPRGADEIEAWMAQLR